MASMQTNRHDDMNEQMTRLQMKLLEQRLDNARKDNPQKELGQGQNRILDPQKIRYHQEVLKRQELLERIKEASKPKALPLHPSSRHSHRASPLPEIRRTQNAGNNTTTQYEDRRSPGRENYINPAISPSPRQNIQPIQTQPIVQPAIVQPVIYQQQPQVLGGVPLIAPTQPPQQGNKSELYDMLMLQNAQMHQLFMQQMLTQGLQTPKHEPQTLVIEQASQPQPFIPPQPQYITLPNTKRRKSKHYHHYNQLPPIHAEDRPLQVNHIHHTEPRRSTPPVNVARPVTRVESPDYNQVRPRPRPAPTSLLPAPKLQLKHPFPGSRALRKLRHIFYAAWFVSFLKIAARKRKEGVDPRFLFGIRLKEAVGALHRIYLNTDGNIYPLLRDVISPGADDLTKAFDLNNQRELQELVHTIENIVYHMTDIMPKTGVLGTHKKAVIFEMLQAGKFFPEGYFWEVENAMMSFDAGGKTTEADDLQAKLLLIGLFISRGLVTTLLMKPLDYGMSSTLLDEIAEQNLRLLASIFVYIVRKVSVPANSKILAMPAEVGKYLYTDAELSSLLDRIKPTIQYADELLRNWIKEYTRRLRAAKIPQ